MVRLPVSGGAGLRQTSGLQLEQKTLITGKFYRLLLGMSVKVMMMMRGEKGSKTFDFLIDWMSKT
ncbi:hypothetical protein OUZ56_012451 [Daphnia magna]|uniref:Uncharacterized protein n=1 Tax=Daphnia magna TaxID=35525 RepID=A0ABQ9Z322_9CRUS|nr:hypothetical protein OUZ56_012451 [Daphnia magna]